MIEVHAMGAVSPGPCVMDLMKDAVAAMSSSGASGSKGATNSSGSNAGDQAVKLIADAKEKSDADLNEKRAEMKRLDARYQATGNEVTQLQRELVLFL